MARNTPFPIQQFRGTAAQNDAYTGPSGELTVDTTNNTIRVHDGSTAGGISSIHESILTSALASAKSYADGVAVQGSTSTAGLVKLSTSTSSTSEALAATSSAVKAALAAAKAYADQQLTATGIASVTTPLVLSNGQLSVNTASTSGAGVVQLSSSTSSTSTTLAATPSAVKAAYDLANSKWTAVSASTSTKGIVKLSTSTSSTSTTLAATPSAVKAAYDLAASKINTRYFPYTDDGVNCVSISSAGALGVQTATTSRYGVVKLSTATNSTSTTLAATPSALRTVNGWATTNYAPTPVAGNNATTLGTWRGAAVTTGSGTSTHRIPSGGTWAGFYIIYGNGYTNTKNLPEITDFFGGVSAGGVTIGTAKTTGPYDVFGFFWRIH